MTCTLNRIQDPVTGVVVEEMAQAQKEEFEKTVYDYSH
jgi:hypothetical protein